MTEMGDDREALSASQPLRTAGGCPMSMLTGTSAGRQARWRQHLVMENGVEGGLSLGLLFLSFSLPEMTATLGDMMRIWYFLHMHKSLGKTRADGGYWYSRAFGAAPRAEQDKALEGEELEHSASGDCDLTVLFPQCACGAREGSWEGGRETGLHMETWARTTWMAVSNELDAKAHPHACHLSERCIW